MHLQCKTSISVVDEIIPIGESDITLEFSESSMARNIFSKMDALNCLYTVQILPRTDKDSMEVFVFEKSSVGSAFLIPGYDITFT